MIEEYDTYFFEFFENLFTLKGPKFTVNCPKNSKNSNKLNVNFGPFKGGKVFKKI